jgi:hypothetical protein
MPENPDETKPIEETKEVTPELIPEPAVPEVPVKPKPSPSDLSVDPPPAPAPLVAPVVERVPGPGDLVPPTTQDVAKDNDAEVTQQKAYEKKDRMMRNFRYAHLPPRLQDVSHRFAINARWIVDNIPSSPERTVALRKLLESKDCAVRARLEGDEPAE